MIIIFVFVKKYLYIYYVIQYSIKFEPFILRSVPGSIEIISHAFHHRMFISYMASLTRRGGTGTIHNWNVAGNST